MAIKSKELCQRTRLLDGVVTYHVVSEDGKLTEISKSRFRDYESSSFRMDTFYGKSDKLFSRSFKTVYFY